MTTVYENYLKTLEEKDWDFARDMPTYEPGKQHDPVKWHNFSYLDYYDKVIGRPYGANGIGKLREVALMKVSEREFDKWWNDGQTYTRWKEPIRDRPKPDIEQMVREQENLAKVYEQNGVEVHWIELPARIGAYGPFNRPSGAVADLWSVHGGIIVGKYGTLPHNNGRASLYARWAAIELGIPTLLTIHGTGVAEVGACVWLAEDILMTGLSPSFNQVGLDQFIPVVKASSKEDVYVHVMRLPNYVFWDKNTGSCAHPNVIIAALDLGKVLLFPPAVGYGTYHWLRENKFEIIETDYDEHVNYYANNLITLEPGKVMMHGRAKNTIAKVRAAGVEVVEVEWEYWWKQTNKIDCVTSKLRRDPGPSFFKDR